MAFLVVQHLDPERPSLLAEILAKKTSMPVAEVEDGMGVAADHVYIIPPNTVLMLDGDTLRLERREEGRQPTMPVDVLFHSLAKERGNNAVGVVLSGSGSDGARGVQAIKEAGGITFAQDEASASFNGMPKSAAGTGCVDFILDPAEIGRTLVRVGQHPYLKAEATDQPSDAAAFKRAFRLLRTASGIDFTHYKRATIERRLARRLAVHHLDKLSEYVDLLQDNPAEVQALAQDLLIGVTSFFRDPDGIEALAQTVFPALMQGRSPKDALRIWVPGCATGEEVYSIAIRLVEFLGERAIATPIQIFGTDVSDTAVERARTGIYLASITAEVSPERLRRFFVKLNDHYQIAKSIRDLCVFARHDATRDPPFSRLDLVSCCNVLIYLDQALQRHMLSLFHYALKPHGFLLLGLSEGVGQGAGLFELVDKRRRLYVAKAVPGRRGLPLELGEAASPARHDAGRAAAPAMLEAERMQREADRVLLARYAPACVLIDEELNVLQFRGQTAPYLEHASGPASLNLRKLAPPGLLIALGPAMQEARRTGAPARTASVRLETREGVREVSLQVSPFQVPDAELRGYLVTFEEAGGEKPRSFWGAWFARARRDLARAAKPTGEDGESARLQRELTATRDYLQAAIEEHEAAKEELRSAHEEVLSSNEELQSTNEELETAKEELQSANEELVTTNEELRNRNRELATLNEALQESRDYAEAIIETARAPAVVLDGSLRVMKANRAFYEGFKVPPEETEGRFIYDLGNRQWDIPKLRTLLEEILPQNSRFADYEVKHDFPDIGEKVMILNALRLAGSKQRPEMILLGIEDATARRRADALELADLRKDEFLAMLAHELRNPLAPIRLAIETMRRAGTDNPTLKFGQDVIDRQTAHMTRLVDDLLDVSRITQGRIALRKEPLALAEVVERAVEAGRHLVDRGKHQLAIVPPRAPIYLEGDPVRLAQVVSNLLDNAAKYTPEGGEITLSTQIAGKDAVLKVSDNGAGIRPEVLPHLFDLFFQADKSPARRHGGMGIGLTLARRIVELHGGSIEANSEGEDKGSELIVRLPRLEQAPARRPAEESKSAPAAAASRRVLIVDDNVDAATTMQSFLQMQGHETRCAFDGPSALSLAQEFAPHLVLLDIAMPGMDGYEVIRRLRGRAGEQPVVAAVTGFGQDTEWKRMKQAGFDHHLVKPVDPQTLAAFVGSLG
jgi:two-component system CheB/CheR fusion protein